MKWPWGRWLVAIAAALFAIAVVVVHFWRVATSVTVVTSTHPAAVKTTTVHSVGSVPLQLGFAGFAAVFALAAVFYDRVTAITLPGGVGIQLSPPQREAASEAVAVAVRGRAATLASAARRANNVQELDLLAQQQPVTRLAVMAAAPMPVPRELALDATEETARRTAEATQRATSYAQTLLRLAQASPDSLRATAEAWGIKRADWSLVMAGEISPGLWHTLAERALDDVSGAGAEHRPEREGNGLHSTQMPAQIPEEPPTPATREQLAEAQAVQVTVSQLDAEPPAGGAETTKPAIVKRLRVIVINGGRGKIVYVQAGLRLSGEGSPRLDRFPDGWRMTGPEDSAGTRDFDIGPLRLPLFIHTYFYGISPQEGVRFESKPLSPKDLLGAYPVVRWTDRWGVCWEHRAGEVRQVGCAEELLP